MSEPEPAHSTPVPHAAAPPAWPRVYAVTLAYGLLTIAVLWWFTRAFTY